MSPETLAGKGKMPRTLTAQQELQPDLLADLDAETWLLNRLKQQAIDVYAHGDRYTRLRDRLAQVIVDNRYGLVVVGRHDGKPETYEQFVLRVFDIKLKDLEKPQSARQRAKV
jgi:hypothetical protein